MQSVREFARPLLNLQFIRASTRSSNAKAGCQGQDSCQSQACCQVQGSCRGQGSCLMAFPLSSGGPGTRHDSHSRRSGRTSTGRPARVIALFGALSGDSESGSGRRFCGIWMSKSVSGNAAKQCEGPGTREDCQKAVQEAWEDVNRVPNTC